MIAMKRAANTAAAVALLDTEYKVWHDDANTMTGICEIYGIAVVTNKIGRHILLECRPNLNDTAFEFAIGLIA